MTIYEDADEAWEAYSYVKNQADDLYDIYKGLNEQRQKADAKKYADYDFFKGKIEDFKYIMKESISCTWAYNLLNTDAFYNEKYGRGITSSGSFHTDWVFTLPQINLGRNQDTSEALARLRKVSRRLFKVYPEMEFIPAQIFENSLSEYGIYSADIYRDHVIITKTTYGTSKPLTEKLSYKDALNYIARNHYYTSWDDEEKDTVYTND